MVILVLAPFTDIIGLYAMSCGIFGVIAEIRHGANLQECQNDCTK